jgi:hypothetical protein
VHRPRVRSYDGREVALPTWTAAQAEDRLGRWAMNLMLIGLTSRCVPGNDWQVALGQRTPELARRHVEPGGLAWTHAIHSASRSADGTNEPAVPEPEIVA